MRVVIEALTSDGDELEADDLPETHDWEEIEDVGFGTEVETIEDFHALIMALEQPVMIEAHDADTEGVAEPTILITLDPAAD